MGACADTAETVARGVSNHHSTGGFTNATTTEAKQTTSMQKEYREVM